LILSVNDLTIHIGAARPVDGISFDIAAGECFALLGESGCGKSMTALGIMRLLPAAAQVVNGGVGFEGGDLLALPESGMREVRGGGIGMIFQEPATSLNPVLTVGRQIVEALELHSTLGSEAARARAEELLDQVGIPDPKRRLDEYPFQLSGGLRQRVMIAIALAGAPRLLIADEPTTALDVTIQAQVLDLLDDLRRKQGMALLLITHDLGVVARMADRVGVMYAGQLVEEAPRGQFFSRPAHPYSVRLFAALPDAERRGGRLATIPGSVPPADARHEGCRFVDRCGEAMPVCRTELPPWRDVDARQRVRCHLPGAAPAVAGGEVGAGDAAIAETSKPLLAVRDLEVHFPIRRGILQRVVGAVRAVDGMSLQLMPGRTLALVGESGCGKTTAGKAMLQLIRPTAGSVLLDGVELTTRSTGELRPLRAKMQMVFQDPFASLNPRLRIGDIIAEGMQGAGYRGWRRSDGDGRPVAGAGRPACRHGRPLSARVFRRTAPAHRHCPRPGGESATVDLRRADVSPGCFGAGADPQPVVGPAARPQAGLPVHHAQHRGGGLPGARRRGDVSRSRGRKRHCRGGPAFAAPSLHQGAAGGGATRRWRWRRSGRSSRATCHRRRIRRRGAISIRAARSPMRVAGVTIRRKPCSARRTRCVASRRCSRPR
jgi:oligopeptide/dipeptide ABC transporter ATP-binding protein